MAIHCNRRGVHTDTPHTSFFYMHSARVFFGVQSHHMAQDEPLNMSVWRALITSSCHHVERLTVSRCFSVPRFVPFRVSLLHFALLFPGKHTLRLRQLRSLALWQNSLYPRVMRPSSLTTSTTRRLLKSSSRRNPATKTRCPRTCVTRNSTMRPSAKRSLHHCSFRSERRISEPKTSLSLSQDILSREACGIFLLLSLHSTRIDCCLSPSCV